MARGLPVFPSVDPRSGEPQAVIDTAEVYLIAIPRSAYKALSDRAAERGQTFAQVLARAIDRELESPSR